MDEKVQAALIAVAGVVLGLLIRDIWMQIYLSTRRREQELADKQSDQSRAQKDTERHYSAPLLRAVESLMYRLKEIVEEGPATYLLPNAPPSEYNQYKLISTVYRLASVLGWIRGYRKERSYLDMSEATSSSEIETRIGAIETALADGQTIELLRFDELAKLWKVPAKIFPDDLAKHRIAAEIDTLIDEQLTSANRVGIGVQDLTPEGQLALCKNCAGLLSKRLRVAIPDEVVSSQQAMAIAYLGIREAYIFRDWQAAIGDLMLLSLTGAARRFDVIGFGDFESRYRAAAAGDGNEKLWFDRLISLFHGLDISVEGMFDARREQIKTLYRAVNDLNEELERRLATDAGARPNPAAAVGTANLGPATGVGAASGT